MIRVILCALLVSQIALAGPARALTVGGKRLHVGTNGKILATANTGVPVQFQTLLASFAPANGAGMGTECACADITLSDGTPVVYQNDAPTVPIYCTKGDEDHVANGSMVLCTNKPRVMRGGDGTGVLGLSVWQSRIHYAQFSQQLDNAAWTKSGVTVTADQAVAPDNTTTADLIVNGGGTGEVYQFTCSANHEFRGCYFRAPVLADGGTNVLNLNDVRVCGGVSCASCSVTSDYWTWCRYSQLNDNSTLIDLVLAPSVRVYGWQADCTDNTAQGAAGAVSPPQTPTLGVSVTTGNEAPFALRTFPMRADLKLTATVQPENATNTYQFAADLQVSTSGVTGFRAVEQVNRATCEALSGGVYTDVGDVGVLSDTAESTLVCTYNGGATGSDGRLEACVGSACVDAGINAAVAITDRLRIGNTWNGFNYTYFTNGVVKQVEVRTTATKDIWMTGDSVVECTGAGPGGQPQFLVHNDYGNLVSVENGGISAFTVEQCKATWDSYVALIVSGGLQQTAYLVNQCGVNSQNPPGDGGTAVANVLWHLETMLLSARDAGIVHAIGSTITPVCASKPFVAAVNPVFQAWAADAGFRVADTWTALNDPSNSGCLLPAYSLDNLHLTDAGCRVETTVWEQTGGWAP